MASTSKGRASRRKAQAPGKLRIQLKEKDAKVVSDGDSNMGDSEEEIAAENGIPNDLPEGTVVVQPEAVEDAQLKSKKAPVRIDTSVLDNVACTACARQLNPYKNGAFQKHPELKVIICKRCEKFLSSGEISKDKDGSDEQCRWCGQGGRLSVCDECPKAFCKACIMRNFGRSEFNNINEQKTWKCYLCNKAALQSQRENYRNVRDTLKALQARDKAKAAAAENKTASTNGTPRSRNIGNNPQGSSNEKREEPSSVTSVTSSHSLSTDDLKFDSAGVAGLMGKLSVATNTFRDMLRALRSQFENQGEEDTDDDGSPLTIKFSLGSNMLEREKERRCAKALSMGLETYFKSLKTILVAHKKADTDAQNVVEQGPSRSSRRASEALAISSTPKQNKNRSSVSNKGEKEKPRTSERTKSIREKTKPISDVDSELDSESDVIILSDSDEGKPKKKKSARQTPKVSLKSPGKVIKSEPSEKKKLPETNGKEDENMAARLELLEEEASQSEIAADNDDENMAARLELLSEQAAPQHDNQADDDENYAARNDLLHEQTSNCDNDDENMAAKQDLLQEQTDTDAKNDEENMAAKLDLLNEFLDDDDDDEMVGELPSVGSKAANQEKSLEKGPPVEEKTSRDTTDQDKENKLKHLQVNHGRESSKPDAGKRENCGDSVDERESSALEDHLENSKRKIKCPGKRVKLSSSDDDDDDCNLLGKSKKGKFPTEKTPDKGERDGVAAGTEENHKVNNASPSDSDLLESCSDQEMNEVTNEKNGKATLGSTKKKNTLESVESDGLDSNLLLSSDNEEVPASPFHKNTVAKKKKSVSSASISKKKNNTAPEQVANSDPDSNLLLSSGSGEESASDIEKHKVTNKKTSVLSAVTTNKKKSTVSEQVISNNSDRSECEEEAASADEKHKMTDKKKSVSSAVTTKKKNTVSEQDLSEDPDRAESDEEPTSDVEKHKDKKKGLKSPATGKKKKTAPEADDVGNAESNKAKKKNKNLSEPVVSDVSSSDLLLSSDSDADAVPIKTVKKKRTKCKSTAGQDKSEVTSDKEKQPETKKQEKEKKMPAKLNSLPIKSKLDKDQKPEKEKQPSSKTEKKDEQANGKIQKQEQKVNGKKNKDKSEEEEDEIDKEIKKLGKLPTLRKRKAKEMEEEGDGLDDGGQQNETENKAQKKYKPGPKSSKIGKKTTDYDNLSSDDEKPASDHSDEDDENDDLEPSVTFYVNPLNAEDEEASEEEGTAKKTVTEDIENDDSDIEEEENKDNNSSSSDDDSDNSKRKTKKNNADSKKKMKRDNKGKEEEADDNDEKSEAKDEDSEDSGDEEVKKKKKKPIHNKLLDANISDSDDSDIGRPKKKKKESESEASKGEESSSGSSLPSDSPADEDDSDLMSDEDGEETKKKKKKGKKKGGKKKKKRKGKKGSDEEAEEEESEEEDGKKKKKRKGKKGSDEEAEEEGSEEEDGKKKKGKGKKRKRIKKIADSSDEQQENDDDDEDDDEKNKSGKRKQIRKVMSNKKLEDSTRAAAKAEEKRRKRIAAKQREFNIETITDENNPMNCPVTTKLILEPGKEEGDPPIVEVNRKLVRKLKPHQVEAVQFMWDCMFESVRRSKKEEGAGCILAHCMGLGKTLSVISFVHTILSHSEVLKQKTCLVVSPLNTVLNWQNEWGIWLDEEDQMNVWELASCKQNPARADMLKEWHALGGILIIGYEMYRNLSQGARCKNKRQKKVFFESLVNPGPDMVVCDEGHILKNEASSISKAMNQMKTRRRVVLTGTPLQNNLNEYHCMLSFVKPNLLGTRKEFNNRFISPIQNGQCTDSTQRDVKLMKARAHVLHEMLAGCVQRRDYSALTKFLPPKQEYVISVRLTNTQIDLYNKYLEMSGQGVDGVFTNKGARLFSDYQNLMKIWTHPWVLKLAEIRDEQKMKYDDEDSFIDDESDGERSFSSDGSSSDEEKMVLSDSGGEGTSLGPHSKKGTRRTRAKARRQAGEDSDPEEVITEWKSKTRNGEPIEEEEVQEGSKSVSKEWWAAYVTEEDQSKIDLSNKLFLLFEILKMCEEIGDKVLIFSQSILSLNIIESFLETVDSKFQQECDAIKEEEDKEDKDEKEQFGRSWTKNLDYYRMDGSTSAQNRQLWAANFNDIENYRTRLFLISTKAGGLGINLVAANRVIIFDASWNPSHDVQSIFRVYRFGQTKPCYIYRFLAQGTMEEKIYERQVTKLSLSQRVVDEHQIERHFSNNDLKELYNFKPDRWDDGTEKPTLGLPKDPLLAEIIANHKHCVLSFHEHDSLLENQVEQTLTEEEKKAAWEEYENEKKGIIVRGPGMERTASWPMMAAAQILSREQITATVQALRQRLPDISEDLFHLHVQQELRRQVQLKQEEMRRMEMLRMQQINIMNMIKYQAQQSGQSIEEVQAQMGPWIQMQMQQMQQMHRMGASQYMAGSSGMHHSASMAMLGNMGGAMGSVGGASAQHISNNPEDAIDLDDN